ncbi:Protein CBG26997 [Caenorhabditis briggsae]|uniref:Ornithine decarboxylase antizyme n=1 Tax=Caenorhabditis briggsae TaxID=6238 RepID=B6IIF4_CAEBR|nr:Protein CBG26997 [Caenorhabditis briggsae]CAR99684.1 Protein CBG26997 [Caenorhabditis briggsae]
MSKKINSNEEEKSIRLVNEADVDSLPTSDGVFDAPQGALQKLLKKAEEIVSSVSPSWQVGNVDEKTLALKIPHDQPALGNLRRNFVDVLEFAEDQLEMNRVLAVFEKSRVKATEGFPRTLRYVGFRPYAINNHPASLPADKYFIMSYKV